MTSATASSTNGRAGLVSALFATTIAALAPALVADSFRTTFEAFGTDLPWITAFFLHHHWWLFAIPAAMLALWFFLHDHPYRGRVVAVSGALCAFVTIATAVTAMYIPIFKLSAVI